MTAALVLLSFQTGTGLVQAVPCSSHWFETSLPLLWSGGCQLCACGTASFGTGRARGLNGAVPAGHTAQYSWSMWARTGASQMTEIPVLRATDLQEDGLQGPGARALSSHH